MLYSYVNETHVSRVAYRLLPAVKWKPAMLRDVTYWANTKKNKKKNRIIMCFTCQAYL